MSAEVTNEESKPNPNSIPRKKPFLGGYRNKLTGQEYHHAKIQTNPPPWKYPFVERFSRATQTVETKLKEQQTAVDIFTQVETRGLFIPKAEYKVVYATGNYVSADEIEKKRLEATITIQRYLRGWICRQVYAALKSQKLARINWDQEQARLREQEEKDWLRDLEYRKEHPKTKDDFTLLFSELQKWWLEQSNMLKNTVSGAELKASNYSLLNQEVEKIQEIEGKRQQVQKTGSLEKRNALLGKVSAPKVWNAYKGPIPVETSGTQRARMMRNLYITLCKPKLIPEDRMAALMQLKETVKQYSCALTSTLISLADREMDLLTRRTAEKNLAGLRLRIRNLLWQFCRQPAFNPEMLRLSKLQETNGKMPLILLCSSCNEHYIMPPDTLEESANCHVSQQRFMKCKKCKYLQNEGWIRKDLEIYKRMLKLLKAEEEKKPTMSGIVYLLQPHDIGFLVEKIWKSQSCLSGLSVLKDLELVRWNVLKNWTPWNCLLTTRDEAILHNHLDDYKKMYDKEFSMSLKLKHIESRTYFSTIPRFLPYFSQPYDNADYDISSEEEDDNAS